MTSEEVDKLLSNCTLCPRMCHADRLQGQRGFCNETSSIMAARAALHMWEEPCISGETGSGAVFFSGCNMHCVFCQNYEIAHDEIHKEISSERLSEIFLELQEQKACNINLVTPTHFVPQIIMAIERARLNGLVLPILYNTSGYENVDTIKKLDGLIDIYLPDCKYFDKNLSMKYSTCPDYFEKTIPAISEMVRQTGSPRFFAPNVHPAKPDANQAGELSSAEYNDYIDYLYDSYDNDSPSDTSCDDSSGDYSGPLMKSGVIVRHLVLPGSIDDSKKVIEKLISLFGKDIYLSIMNQYTPMPHSSDFEELSHKVSSSDYDMLLDFAIEKGLENGFFQGSSTSQKSFIPAFDFKGL